MGSRKVWPKDVPMEVFAMNFRCLAFSSGLVLSDYAHRLSLRLPHAHPLAGARQSWEVSLGHLHANVV